MSKVRYHYEYARTGTPSQECDESYGKEPPKTDWDEGTRKGSNAPHGEEKGEDR